MDFCLIVPDVHIPFEDKRAFELMLQVARSLKIKIVVLLGDFLDMYGLSYYDKHPGFGDMADLYEREIECGIKRKEQLESLNAGMYVYLEGNHEVRLKNFVTKNIPAIRRRITLPMEMKLGGHWRWVPFDGLQRFQIPSTKIWCRHCAPAGGAIDNIAKQAGDTIIFGHDHQVREADFITKASFERNIALGSGWLGDETQPVFEYTKRKPNWGLAFRLVDEHHNVHLVRIQKKDHRYVAVFGDREFIG